jgi:hypothetical protein
VAGEDGFTTGVATVGAVGGVTGFFSSAGFGSAGLETAAFRVSSLADWLAAADFPLLKKAINLSAVDCSTVLEWLLTWTPNCLANVSITSALDTPSTLDISCTLTFGAVTWGKSFQLLFQAFNYSIRDRSFQRALKLLRFQGVAQTRHASADISRAALQRRISVN